MSELFRPMDWSLRVKMAALLVIASLLPLAAATWLDIREARQRLVMNTADLLAARGDHLAAEIDAFHRVYQVSVAKLARLPLIVEFCRASPEESERLEPALGSLFDAELSADPNLRGVVILDLAGTAKVATERQLIGKNLAHQGAVREAMRGRTAISDIDVAEAPGSDEPTIAYLAPVLEPHGSPIIGASKIARDISARTQAEKAVRQSEAQYRALFDTLIEGFCTIELIFDARGNAVDFRFLEVNPAFEKQTGLREAQGKRMRELAPNHEEYWFEIFGKVALTGEPAQFENEAQALGRHYDVCAYQVGGPESRKVAVLFNDVTERKRAEVAVRESEDPGGRAYLIQGTEGCGRKLRPGRQQLHRQASEFRTVRRGGTGIGHVLATAQPAAQDRRMNGCNHDPTQSPDRRRQSRRCRAHGA